MFDLSFDFIKIDETNELGSMMSNGRMLKKLSQSMENKCSIYILFFSLLSYY
jgi:hypothetical protein